MWNFILDLRCKCIMMGMWHLWVEPLVIRWWSLLLLEHIANCWWQEHKQMWCKWLEERWSIWLDKAYSNHDLNMTFHADLFRGKIYKIPSFFISSVMFYLRFSKLCSIKSQMHFKIHCLHNMKQQIFWKKLHFY